MPSLPPVTVWPQRVLIGLVKGYRFFLSPWLGSACRFEPTCSRYALQALQSHGAWHGSLLTGRRLMRCHPWCAGGLDPVPDNARRPAGSPSTAAGSGDDPFSASNDKQP